MPTPSCGTSPGCGPRSSSTGRRRSTTTTGTSWRTTTTSATGWTGTSSRRGGIRSCAASPSAGPPSCAATGNEDAGALAHGRTGPGLRLLLLLQAHLPRRADVGRGGQPRRAHGELGRRAPLPAPAPGHPLLRQAASLVRAHAGGDPDRGTERAGLPPGYRLRGLRPPAPGDLHGAAVLRPLAGPRRRDVPAGGAPEFLLPPRAPVQHPPLPLGGRRHLDDPVPVCGLRLSRGARAGVASGPLAGDGGHGSRPARQGALGPDAAGGVRPLPARQPAAGPPLLEGAGTGRPGLRPGGGALAPGDD